MKHYKTTTCLLKPESYKAFIDVCMDDSSPNDQAYEAAERYAKMQEVCNKRINKEWLDSLQTEDEILEACVELCKKNTTKKIV